MSIVEWEDNIFSVGVKEIDNQHKKWIDLINELNESIRNSRQADILVKVFQDMVDYCNYHFCEEEKLMKKHGYPGYEAHRARHEGFRELAINYKKDLENGEAASRLEVIVKLVDWLKNHILTVDKEMGRFLAKKTL